MRIAAGALRGRRVSAPPGAAVRPTGARLRRAIFDVLAHNPAFAGRPVAGAAAVDAFAGAGTLGLEALSRGAARIRFIDRDRRALAALRANAAALGVAERVEAYARDATAPGPAPAPADFAFLDPPWDSGLAAPALAALAANGWLAPGAVAALEHPAARPPAPPEGFETVLVRRHGRGAATFLRRIGAGAGP